MGKKTLNADQARAVLDQAAQDLDRRRIEHVEAGRAALADLTAQFNTEQRDFDHDAVQLGDLRERLDSAERLLDADDDDTELRAVAAEIAAL